MRNLSSTATKRVKSANINMPTSEEDLQRQMLMHDDYFMDLEHHTLTEVGFALCDQPMAMHKDRGAGLYRNG